MNSNMSAYFLQATDLSESPSLLSSSSSIISSLESSESSEKSEVIDSSEHSLFDLIL